MKELTEDEIHFINYAVKHANLDEALAEELLNNPERARAWIFAAEAYADSEYERQREEGHPEAH